MREGCTIIFADRPLSRMKGLLGTKAQEYADTHLVIRPCRAIHTIGMRYPLDVAFFDSQGIVLASHRGVRASRILVGPRSTAGVVERPAHRGIWYGRGDVVEGI